MPAFVEVCDNGEPGTGADSFSIEVFVGDQFLEECSGSGTLAGGNVQVREYGNCAN